MSEIFQRAEILLGSEAMERLAAQRVILFGVGGVGSWCAECLVRTGLRHLTIVDDDCVVESNINRQLMATSTTVGQVKVDALRQRLLAINPEADITALPHRFTAATAEDFHLDTYDYIIDAIDSLADKAALLLLATQTPASVLSSMGAALKLDPSRIRVATFNKVQGDPLARALRNRFKREQRFPARPIRCVFSDEPPLKPAAAEAAAAGISKGSIAHITAIFGLTLASIIIRDMASVS